MSLLRKTTQNPLPVCKPETGKNQYDIYPTHDLGPDKIFCDYTSLARRLAGQKQVVVDGYVGVRFDLFRQELLMTLKAVPDEVAEGIVDEVFLPLVLTRPAGRG